MQRSIPKISEWTDRQTHTYILTWGKCINEFPQKCFILLQFFCHYAHHSFYYPPVYVDKLMTSQLHTAQHLQTGLDNWRVGGRGVQYI